jgi:hypothetical protein
MGWGNHPPRNWFVQAWEYGNHYESLYFSGEWWMMRDEQTDMGHGNQQR